MTQTLDLARLEALLRDLGGATDSPCEIIREHLKNARGFLLNSNQDQYATCLTLAQQVISRVSDEELRLRIYGFIESQRRHESLRGNVAAVGARPVDNNAGLSQFFV